MSTIVEHRPLTAAHGAPSTRVDAPAAARGAPSTGIAVEPRRRYLDNLEALYAIDPELAAAIDALPFSSLPALERTRSGDFTARVATDDGRGMYVHSRYNPPAEAATLVEQQTRRTPASAPATDANTTDPSPSGAARGGAADATAERPADVDADAAADLLNESFFLDGVGLGYAIAALDERFDEPVVIAAEPDLALVKGALLLQPLAKGLLAGRVRFLTEAEKSAVHQRLQPVLTHLMLGLRFLASPHAARRQPRFHIDLSALLRDFIVFSRMQTYSLVRNARITCKNVAFNLRPYLAQPGVEVLAERARGYPAILIAAGPSLARCIDRLAALRDRAVLIAVQTVLKTLLARGVQPHFVTSLDYHELSAQFFRGVDDFGDVALVCEPKATWHVLDAFRGRTHVLHSSFADDLLRDAAPARGRLRAGSTVAHLSFYLAEHLGCDPLIFVGQDLSFSEGLYYPPGMPIERVWGPELGRFNTLEMKQWERIVRARAGLRRVIDVNGRDTYTDEQMFVYAEQFQADFQTSRSRIVQCAEGGMRLSGAEVMPLDEAVERFCTRALPNHLFAAPAQASATERLRAAEDELHARTGEVRAVREIAVQTRSALAALEPLVTDAAAFNRRVAEVDSLRARMERHARTYELVTATAQLAELRRIAADRAIRDDHAETPAMARRRLRRDREFVQGFIEACDYLLDVLPQAASRLREEAA